MFHEISQMYEQVFQNKTVLIIMNGAHTLVINLEDALLNLHYILVTRARRSIAVYDAMYIRRYDSQRVSWNLLNSENIEILKNLFNLCLDTGVYPWNNGILISSHLYIKSCSNQSPFLRALALGRFTPKRVSTRCGKYKKGCKEDPDNYRVVAVSSTIGKLFQQFFLKNLKNLDDRSLPSHLSARLH